MIERFRLWLRKWLGVEAEQQATVERFIALPNTLGLGNMVLYTTLHAELKPIRNEIDDLRADYAARPQEKPEETDEAAPLQGFTRFTTRRAQAQRTGSNPNAYRVPTPKIT